MNRMAISRSSSCRLHRGSALRHRWTIWKRSFNVGRKKNWSRRAWRDQTETRRHSRSCADKRRSEGMIRARVGPERNTRNATERERRRKSSSNWQLAVDNSPVRRGSGENAATFRDLFAKNPSPQKQKSNQPFECGERDSKANCYLLITICLLSGCRDLHRHHEDRDRRRLLDPGHHQNLLYDAFRHALRDLHHADDRLLDVPAFLQPRFHGLHLRD
jgi:hypothetical protein